MPDRKPEDVQERAVRLSAMDVLDAAEISEPSSGAVARSEEAQGFRPVEAAPRRSPWIDAAHYLIVWLPAAAMALCVKWYTMTDLGGFAKATRSMGYMSLSFGKRLSFFNGEILLGFLLIPASLLLLNRYLGRWWAAIVTPLASIAYILLFAVQLRALEEVGRYISLHIINAALDWGLHEPGANIGYLSATGIAAIVAALVVMGAVIVWSFRRSGHIYSDKAIRTVRTSGELYVLAIVVIQALGWQTKEFVTPYHESTFKRAVVSLWREKSVDTGEFADFNLDRLKQLNFANMDAVSSPELIAQYRSLAHAPAASSDPRYFGKEAGDNVLFFIMETTPDEFLPADDDMSEFPNMRRLREKSFVGERHYTTLPFTQCALFSVFSSWYPLDTLHSVRGYPAGEIPPNFLYHLNASGYESAAFTPLTGPNNPDEAIYEAVGFKDHFYLDPNAALPPVPSLSGWKAHRVGADLLTLQNLESHMDEWIRAHQHFVAAYLPQVGHYPLPDRWGDDSEENLRSRGRAIIAIQDAWLGQLMEFLSQRGELDHTIILVFGDHGRRNTRENPDLRRGTVDETAFHVPLLIYAPRTLDHTERIPWVTSHIDLAPTVLDLLGIKRDDTTAQGSAIWNPTLADRATFFFAQPLFGADGYVADGKFYMWHYYSDMVYANNQAFFDDKNFVMRQSPIGREVTSNIRAMVSLQAAWQSRFAVPPQH